MTKKLFAITGGIGSGKSLVLSTLKDAGFLTLSSDQIVSELYKTHKVKVLLKQMFPSAVNGQKHLTINRAEISRIVFFDKAKHKALTDAITPLVLQKILNKAKTTKTPLFVEVPLLFECNYQNHFDDVIVVMRDKKERIESVKERSNLSQEQILARMSNQVDYDALDKTPYTIITNDCDAIALKEKAIKVANELIK